jgi:hypothetical protein
MAELVASLVSFLETNNALSWRAGTVDCCIVLADWAVALGHPDPASHLRGRYDSDDGFRQIIAAAGGAVPVVERCVKKIGGERVDRPLPGAIGVIGSPHNIERQWGAIFDGQRWLVRFSNGFAPMAASSLAIWKI